MKTVTFQKHMYKTATYKLYLSDGSNVIIDIVPTIMRKDFYSKGETPYYSLKPEYCLENSIRNKSIRSNVNMASVVRYVQLSTGAKEFVVRKTVTTYFGLTWDVDYKLEED